MEQYELTDGEEVYKLEWFTAEELAAANRLAQDATDGNIWWQPVVWHEGDADCFRATYVTNY